MIEEFYERNPYSLNKESKDILLTKELLELTEFHKKNSIEYSNFLETINYKEHQVKCVADIPFFPVRMFKEYDLLSIDSSNVFKVMTSSGTTGQRKSKIYVNKETAMMQQKVMIKILSDFWGKKRMPILVIDAPSVIKDRKSFSARGAAIMGLQIIAKKFVFALNEDMTLNVPIVKDFLAKYGNENFIIFGFTFIVWQSLYKQLLEQNYCFDMSNAWLMTGGGWKKLESEMITRQEFKDKFRELCKVNHFLDHYGMVEQTGCLYAECEYGHLHASIYSDVIIRNHIDFSPCKTGERGLIQVVSVIPHSYPGHSLLTEDEGMILGEDDCPCGRKGKYIKVFGRVKMAEIRGCSDTYAGAVKR